MHLKYRQDNLYCMTWYTGTCSIMAMGLLYELTLGSNVCVAFGSNGFVTKMQSFPMDSHYRTNDINGVGHPRSYSIVLLVLCTVYYTMVGAPTLYYKSLITVSTLLRRGNILGRPYC
jgi:hypothetical protein